jgi:hypothetical protein
VATVEDVRRIALSLPETSEGPLYGTPGWRVREKAFARLRPEGDVLVVWCADEGEKAARIATEQEIYFTLPHYDGHPSVLVRLPAIEVEELREALTDAWYTRAPRRLRLAFDAAQEQAAAERERR